MLPERSISGGAGATGCALIAVILVLSGLTVSVWVAVPSGGTSGGPTEGPLLAVHPPIDIEGDAGFTPANGVTGGSGTPADPYIIEGWDINASLATGIKVNNTASAFVVRDLSVHDSTGTFSLPALEFVNVTGGRIDNVTVASNRVNILSFSRVANLTLENSSISSAWLYLSVVSNVTVARNVVSGTASVSIRPDRARNLTIDSNVGYRVEAVGTGRLGILEGRISGNAIGPAGIGVNSDAIWLNGSWGVHIANNTLRGTTAAIGVVLWGGSHDIDITGNRITGFARGITDLSDQNTTITGNDVEGNAVVGISTYARGSVVAYNTLASNGVGVEMTGTDTLVHHNDFTNNTLQADPQWGTNHSWDDGYPSGGNYWSDYAGVDLCKGPLQNDCTGGDGIGDTPRPVNATEADRYPLMAPVGGDTIPPGVAIGSPADGSTVDNATLSVSGTAWDFGGSGLASVKIRVNAGAWSPANGTTAWSGSVTLVNGTNRIDSQAWDGAGNPSAIAGANVTYSPPPPPPPPPNNPPYYLNASWTPWTGNTSTVFAFTARTFDDHDPPGALRVRWDWENDGVWDTPLSTDKNASHTYPVAGNYTFKVQAMDTANLTTNRTFMIMVTEPPPPPPPTLEAVISATPTSGTMPLTVSFTSEVTGGVPPYWYDWTLGDGGKSPAANTVHIYVTGGNFTVWLIVADHAGGNVVSNVLWVNVTSAMVNLTVIPPTEFATTRGGVNATLRSVVWGGTPPYTYAWDFGDGETGTGPEPTHTYPGPGTYDVNLTVTDSAGRTASYSMELVIPPHSGSPAADLTGLWVAVGVAAGALAGAGGHTLWTRRRARRPPERPPPDIDPR